MHDSEKNRVLLLTFARILNVFFMWLSLFLLVAGLALLVKGGRLAGNGIFFPGSQVRHFGVGDWTYRSCFWDFGAGAGG